MDDRGHFSFTLRTDWTTMHYFGKKVNDIWGVVDKIRCDIINVCCSRVMAEHLMNLCSSQQTQSWVASMWSFSIFHCSGQRHLTVSPPAINVLRFSLNLIFVSFPMVPVFLYYSRVKPLHFFILSCCQSNSVSNLHVRREISGIQCVEKNNAFHHKNFTSVLASTLLINK